MMLTAVPRFTTALGPGSVAWTLPVDGSGDRRPDRGRPAVERWRPRSSSRDRSRWARRRRRGPSRRRGSRCAPRAPACPAGGSVPMTVPAGDGVAELIRAGSARGRAAGAGAHGLGRGLPASLGTRAGLRALRHDEVDRGALGDLGARRAAAARHRPGHDDAGRHGLVELRRDARRRRARRVSSWLGGVACVLPTRSGSLAGNGARPTRTGRWWRPRSRPAGGGSAGRRRPRRRCRRASDVCSTFQPYWRDDVAGLGDLDADQRRHRVGLARPAGRRRRPRPPRPRPGRPRPAATHRRRGGGSSRAARRTVCAAASRRRSRGRAAVRPQRALRPAPTWRHRRRERASGPRPAVRAAVGAARRVGDDSRQRRLTGRPEAGRPRRRGGREVGAGRPRTSGAGDRRQRTSRPLPSPLRCGRGAATAARCRAGCGHGLRLARRSTVAGHERQRGRPGQPLGRCDERPAQLAGVGALGRLRPPGPLDDRPRAGRGRPAPASACRCRLMSVATVVSAANGTVPVTDSTSTRASEYTSLLPSTAMPLACSGEA